MITLDDLCTLAEINRIKIIFENLRQINISYLGKADASNKIITLDISLRENTRESKCVLAEEIGHILYPPRPGHIRYHSRGYWQIEHHDRSLMGVIVAQDERKALDWATRVLIPDDEFWQANKECGMDKIYLLVDWFDVEPWVVNLKIGYLRRKRKAAGEKLKWRDIIKRD